MIHRSKFKYAAGRVVDQNNNPIPAGRITELLNEAYNSIGVYTDGVTLKNEASNWIIGEDERDPGKHHFFIALKKTPFGMKSIYIGHDGSREAKSELMRYKRELYDIFPHVYSEASGKMQEILESWGIPKVSSKYAGVILNKEVTIIDEFTYARNLNGSLHEKTLYGYPRLS